MADLQFNEGQEFARPDLPPPSFLTQLVLKTGLVETEQAAQYVLFGLFVIFTIATLWIVLAPEKTSSQTGSPIMTLKMIKELSDQPPRY